MEDGNEQDHGAVEEGQEYAKSSHVLHVHPDNHQSTHSTLFALNAQPLQR